MTERIGRIVGLGLVGWLSLGSGSFGAIAKAEAQAESKAPAKAEAQAEPKTPAKVPNQPRRPVNIRQIIRAIGEEGMKAAKANWNWPTESQAAKALHENPIERSVVLRQLATPRLHFHPAVDSYIRFQLLSALPGSPRLEPAEAKALFQGLPMFYPYPGIGAANEAMLKQFNARVIGPREKPQLDRLLGLFDEAQKIYDTANAYANNYFDHVGKMMPEEDGLRLLLLIERIDRQFQAGNPNVYKLMRPLQQAINTAAGNTKVTAAMRRILIVRMAPMTQYKKTVFVGGRIDNNDRFRVLVRPMGLSKNTYATYTDLLLGKTQPHPR